MLSKETKQELILSLLDIDKKTESKSSFYQVGKVYVLRSVTMIYLGRLKEETSDALILEDAAWIPETSRWNEFLKGKSPNEMEPYADNVIVYKGGLIDATVMSQKMDIKVI